MLKQRFSLNRNENGKESITTAKKEKQLKKLKTNKKKRLMYD